jgi:hypothetical protein
VTPTATVGDAVAYSPGLVLWLKNTNGAANSGTFTLSTNANEMGDVVADVVYTLAPGAELLVSNLSPVWDQVASGTSRGRIVIIPAGDGAADLRYCAISNG